MRSRTGPSAAVPPRTAWGPPLVSRRCRPHRPPARIALGMSFYLTTFLVPRSLLECCVPRQDEHSTMKPPDATAKSILVVEDDRGLRLALTRLLAQDFHVDDAADGTEAMARLQSHAYDLVLLDLGLPGMSGLEVLAHLPSGRASPKVIVMTATTRRRRCCALFGITPGTTSSSRSRRRRSRTSWRRRWRRTDRWRSRCLSARPEWVELLGTVLARDCRSAARLHDAPRRRPA